MKILEIFWNEIWKSQFCFWKKSEIWKISKSWKVSNKISTSIFFKIENRLFFLIEKNICGRYFEKIILTTPSYPFYIFGMLPLPTTQPPTSHPNIHPSFPPNIYFHIFGFLVSSTFKFLIFILSIFRISDFGFADDTVHFIMYFLVRK